MSTRDLNIIDRGIAGQDWSQERGKISAKELSAVMEESTSSTSALNALPTPFARFYVVKEAFRRVKEEYVSKRSTKSQDAGYAYHQLVSDCLDVYELLFNLKYHRNHWKEKEILIREWNKETEMARLKESVPKLYNSVSAYWDTDINLDKLYFIILREGGKEKLLATSSPWTGFVTPPDLDKTFAKDDSNTVNSKFNAVRYADLQLKKKDKGEYFRNVVLFEDRPVDFKNYMYNVLFGSTGLDGRLSEIRDYIREFKDDKDIRNDYKQVLRPVKTVDDNDLVVNGLVFSSKDEKDVVSMFNDVVIKLPYRISQTNYVVPQMNGKEDRTHDYLLPLSEEALQVLDLDAIKVLYKEYGGEMLEVTVKDTDGKVYKRTYSKNGGSASSTGVEGRVVDLSDREYNINIDTALFPSLLHCSANAEENNYFKLMVAVRDANRMPRLKGEDVDCTFYTKDKDGRCERLYKTEALDKNGLTSGSKMGVVRSVQDANSACSTVFFEVFNAVPCAFSIHLKLDGQDVSGLLVPHVKESSATVKLTYAIDFGTTNTYISKRVQGSDVAPSQLTMTDTMMSYLHGVAKTPKKPIDLWEDVPFADAKSYFQTEFVPPFIDGEKYKFPLRTAISKRVRKDARAELFDNCNIAFSYGKTKKAGDNEVSTDIKWDGANDDRRLFIRELLMIIKADALQSNADLARTKLVWFYPLSMRAEVLNDLAEIWDKQAEEVLGIPATQIKHYTESEVPYYYFSRTDDFKAVSSVAIIDIGGGSTDVVYFENNKSLLANSVHFGCDVMWGNAYDKMVNSRKNGIYEYYKNQVTFPTDATLKGVNEEMTADGSTSSTRDIINFWIANSDKIEVEGHKFNKVLRRDCKPLFLYHYAAIIYYMARMFKSRDLACPRDIAFSGNGSRYIDGYLTSNIKTLEEITKKVFCKVYGNEVDDIHIILPECRKETTCYGGLYRDCIQGQSPVSPEEIFFQGVDKTEYEKVADLRKAFDSGLRTALIESVEELNAIYLEMLDILTRKDDIQNISVSSLTNGMLSNEIADSLDKNFQNEVVSKYGDNMKYRDSLFFLPIVSNILALTDVTKYNMENDN